MLYTLRTDIDNRKCCGVAWRPLGGDTEDTLLVERVEEAVIWHGTSAVEGKASLYHP